MLKVKGCLNPSVVCHYTQKNIHPLSYRIIFEILQSLAQLLLHSYLLLSFLLPDLATPPSCQSFRNPNSFLMVFRIAFQMGGTAHPFLFSPLQVTFSRDISLSILSKLIPDHYLSYTLFSFSPCIYHLKLYYIFVNGLSLLECKLYEGKDSVLFTAVFLQQNTHTPVEQS